ncbi:MAG: SCO family protein [Pirellulaceae bacterium]
MKTSLANLLLLLVALSGCASLASRASAQLLKEELPLAAQSINIENRVGEFIPLDLIFKDERGNAVGLGRYFKQGKPIVLTLNYSDCPGLCVAQLDMLVETLRDLSGAAIGDDFEILTVSIDPTESPEKAARSKAKYAGLLSGEGAQKGWHFLTGKQADIAKLADAVGFRYSYDKANDRYNHAAATYFLSSDGRVCRYLLSLGAEPQQFQFAIAEAAEGKLTRTFSAAIIQMCYMYDPEANRYTASARRLLALAAGAFVILLTGFTAPFWFSGRARKNQTSLASHLDAAATERQSLVEPNPNSPADVPSASTELVK